jgi:elongation factor G
MDTLHFPQPIKAEGRFIRQSGPIGRFGHVVLIVEQSSSERLEFSWQVPASAIPAMFQSAVVRGVTRLFEPGAKLAEFSPSSLHVRVVGGTFHPTDSNEGSYEVASANAFINAVSSRSQQSDA